jgi:gliding motility-associated-like protein/uncharacterized repeat protein (TIGR01451 family)
MFLYRLSLIVSFLLSCNILFAEGSKDLFPNPNPNPNAKRAYVNDGSLVYAWAKAGETIYVGSSAQGFGNGRIILTSPTGVVTSTTIGSTTGRIATRNEELLGPSAITVGGYNAFSVAVTAATAGVWKIQFRARQTGGDGNNPGNNDPSVAFETARNNFVAAFDVTVANGSSAINGRAYMTIIRGNMGGWNFGTGSWWSTIYAQTRDGYRYTVNTNGIDPFGFQFFINNKGVRSPAGTNGPPAYISANSTSNASFVASGLDLHNPDNADDVSNVTHKMFFNNLANDLPATAPVFLNNATNTWLLNAPVNPVVSNVSLVGIEGQAGFGGTPPLNGGYINFSANQNGSYRIRIDANNNGIYTDAIDTVLTGTAAAGPNARYWSGKNGFGNILPSGTPINIEVITFAGEVHFPLFDSEENVNGMIITRINGSGAPNDLVYWNDTRLRNTSNQFVTANATTSNPLDATADAGISSTANGHKWQNGNQDITGANDGFGNQRLMDTWTYVFSAPIVVVTTLVTKEANLEIVSNTNSVNNICVGTDVTYTFVARNNGPDDAPLSKVSFVAPSNLTNLQLVSATLNTGVASGIGGSFTGNIFNDTLTTFNNGATVTYVIKGTVSSWPTGNNLITSARILRPADVTDPDASNPDPAPPTDPENECNSAPSGAGCNNIKNNTVTVFATPTTSIAAAASATLCNASSFTMAANTPIHGTGLWTLVNGTAVITTPSSASTTVTGVPAGTSATLKWTISNGTCTSSESTVTINNNQLPTTANAGSNLFNCNNGNFSISANSPTVGTGMWSLVSGTATIANPTATATNVSGVAAGSNAIVRWSISNGVCPASTADITLTNHALPTTSNAGVAKENCNSGNFTMTAITPTVGVGTWTLVNGTATIANTNAPNTAISGVPVGTSATLRWTISNGNCTASFSDVVLTNFANPTTAVAGNNQTQCNNATFTMAANTPIVGTGVWSIVSGNATIASATQANTSVTGVTAGTSVTLKWTITNGNCNASSANVTITNLVNPNTANAGNNQTNCNNGNFNIVGNTPVAGTTGTWSVLSGVATIANVNSAVTTVSGIAAGSSAVLQWRISNGICTPSTATITLTNNALPSTANAGINQTLCNAVNTTVAANVPSIGTGVWSQVSGPNTATIVNTTTASTTIQGLIAGNYTFRWTITNANCTPSTSDVTITNLPTVNAGADRTISCATTTTITAAASGNNWLAAAGNPANATITNNGAITGLTVIGNYRFVLQNAACTDTVVITRVNCAPTATPAANSVNEDTPVSGSLASNAADFDGDALTFTIASPSKNGSIVINPNGTYTYTPNPNFNGRDTIVYRVCDINGACVNQQLIITVNPVNDAPIAVNDNATTVRDVPVSGNVRNNDSDIENSTLTVQTTPVQNPSNGTVVLNANGNYTYTPTPGFVGIDSFKYSICDPGPLCSTATVYINVTAGVIDLAITKTASPTNAVAGSTITYTLTVRNNGPSTINSSESFVVKDNLPSGFTANSFTPSAGNYNSNTNTFTGVTLAPNATVTLTILGTVNAAYTNNNITNTATATPPNGTTDPTPATATNTTTVTKRASIVVTKNSSAATFVPGTTLVYTIKAINNGPSDVIGATVVDALPTGITSASWTAITTGGASVPIATGIGAINQTVNIPNGGSIVYTLSVAVPANFANNTLSNTATVNFPSDVTNATPGTNTATETDTRNRVYDIAIVKTAPSVATAGGNIRYQINITNNGPSDLINAAINDVVPATVTNVTWSVLNQGLATTSTTSGTGNNINLSATIPAGNANRIILTIDGRISSAATGNITNTAAITPPGATAISSNTTTTQVQTITGLQVVKAGPSSNTVIAGQPITFSIEVINSGPSNAVGANFSDVIPNNIQNVTWSVITKGNATATLVSGTGNNINFGTSIPAGNNNGVSVIVTGTVASNALSNIVNTATITPASGSPSSGQSVTAVINQPRLQISKSAPATSVAGTPITFTLTASNSGSSDAFNVAIADTVVSEITVLSYTATTTGTATIIGATSGTGNIVGINANIPTGAANTVTITINGIVTSSATGVLNNRANISLPGGTPIQSNRTDTRVISLPNLNIVKTAPATAQSGGQISYVLRITNNGPSDAFAVVVRDTLPQELTNISVTTQTIGNGTSVGSAMNDNGRIVARNINIPVGNNHAVLITITGTINPAFAGGIIKNTASVQAPNVPEVISNETSTNVSVTPGLQIAKSGNTTINAGERITYTISVTNIGPSNANGITITDNVPATIKNVSWRTNVVGTGTNVLTGATGNGNNILVTGNITARLQSKINIIVTGIVDSSFSGTINNIATVSGGGSPTINSNTLNTTVTKEADLRINKSAPNTLSAGETIRYNIVVQNQGPSLANNITISDLVSTEITNVTWTATASGNATVLTGATGSGNNIVVTGNISNNTTSNDRITIAIVGRINPATAVNSIQNIATAVPAAGTTDPSPATDTVNTTIQKRANLRIRKSASPANAVNQTITYTLSVTNNGPSAVNNFVLTDTIPASISNITFTTNTVNNASVNTAALNGNIFTLNGNIGANTTDTVLVTLTGILTEATMLTNRATVNPPIGVIERNPANNISTVTTNVTNKANILIAKTGPPTARVNETIQYRIDINNVGVSDANGVVIIDTIPAALTNVNWSVIKTSGGTATNFITNTATNSNIINVLANIQGTITGPGGLAILVSGTIANNAPNTITNNAYSTFNGITQQSSVNTTIDNTVDLVIQKTAPTQIAAGNAIQYTITAYNNGPANAINSNIIDTVAANITNVTWVATTSGAATISNGSSNSGVGNIVQLNANLPSGSNNIITIVVNGTVDAGATGTINNKATATPTGGQTDSTIASSTVNTNIVQQSNILINKTAPTTIAAGNTISYTITVNNNGPSNANAVAINDIINSNITNVSWVSTTTGLATITSGATGSGNTLNSIVNIPAGANNMVNFTITGIVNPSFTGNIANTATATNGSNIISSPTLNTNVVATPSLMIKKSGPTNIIAGETITYSIDVNNNGPSNANGITITDAVTNTIINPSWVASTTGNATILTGATGTGNSVSVTGNINAGANNKITIVITGVVNPAFTGTSFNNFALVNGGGSPQISSDTIITTVAKTADITIQKIGPATIVAGERIRYSIIVRNNGPSNATNVNIVDNVPANILNTNFTATAFGTATVSATSGSGNNINLTSNIPVGNANYIEIIVNGMVDAATVATSITNTAAATLPPGITDNTPAIATTTATVNRLADVSIVKSGPGDLATNQTINYTLTIINKGPSNATGITITDIIPASISSISFTTNIIGNAAITNSSLVGNTLTIVGDIGSGNDTIKVNITGIATSAGILTNTATVALPSNQTDPTPGNNSSTINTNVTTQTNLVIAKKGPATVNVNDNITYEIEVSNTGVSDALGVIITDAVSADITNVTWSVAKVTGTNNTLFTPTGIQTGNNIYIEADVEGTINGPGKLLITINGTVANNASSTISNTAQLDYAGIKQSSVVTIVNNSADLTIQKNAPTSINAGEKIRYTLVVGNKGPANATDITITDIVPSAIENVTYTAIAEGAATVNTTSGTGNNIAITGNINSGINNRIIVTIEGTVNAAATGVLNNTATATPNASQVDPSPATAATSTTISNAVNFTINKAAPTTGIAGGAIVYTITASNFGPSNANNITITDVVPTAITNITYTAVATGTATIIGSSAGVGNNIAINANLPAGSNNSITITINGTINANFTGNTTNTATLNYNGSAVASAAATTNVSAQPGLKIVKGGALNAPAGTTVNYTIDVTNVGPSNANGITINDVIAPQLKNVSWVATSKGNASILSGTTGIGNTINITGNIAAGNNNGISVLITGTIDSSYSGTINNSATVGGGGSSTITSNNIATTVALVADISITKNAPQNAVAGNAIQYTLIVKNNGPSTANNIAITDIVSSEITNVSYTATASGNATILTGATGTGNTVNVTSNISTNNTTDFITITINGMINAASTVSSIVNTASASLPVNYTDPITSNNSSSTTTNIAKMADIRIIKSGPANRATNQSITYILLVVNQGPSVVNGLTISDIVPAAISNVSATATAIGNATASVNVTNNTVTVNCNIGAAITDSIKVTITGVLTTDGIITNTATVTLPAGITDPIVSNNTSSVNTQVSNNVGILISKTAPAIVNVKEQITYIIDVLNTGLSNATNIAITDNIPAGITNVNWVVTKISGGSNTNFTINSPTNSNTVNVTANIEGTLNGNGALRITITGTVANNAPATITNLATAVYAGTFTSAATTAVNNSVDLDISKTAPTSIAAGLPITYTITTTNNGPADAIDAVIIDTINAAISNVSWVVNTQGTATLSSSQASSGSGNIINILGNIPSGNNNAITVTITGTVNPSFTGTINNTAIANPAAQQTDPTPASSTVQTNVVNSSNLLITKAGPTTILAGNPIAYTIVINNAGPSNATNIQVTDAIPAAITNVSWVATTSGLATISSSNNGTGNFVDLMGNIPFGANNTITINITGVVNPSFTGNFSNTANLIHNGIAKNSNTVNTVVSNAAALVINKTGAATINAGERMVYTIEVLNNGPSNSNGATIADIVPTTLSNVIWSTTTTGNATITSGATGIGNNVTVVGNIPAGSGNSILLTISGIVNAGFTGSFTNTASITTPFGIITTSPTVVTNVTRKTNIAITKVGAPTVIASNQLQYTINVSNAGPSNANNITITDIVPAALQSVSYTATAVNGATVNGNTTASGTGNNISLNATIPANPNSYVRIVVTGTVNQNFSGTITNIATAQNSGEALVTDTAITIANQLVDVDIAKTGPSIVLIGNELRYRFVVSNKGPSGANGAMFTDVFSSNIGNLNMVVVSTNGGASGITNTIVGNTVNANIANFPSGSSVVFEIFGTALTDGVVSNTATITAPPGVIEPNLGNNTAAAMITNIYPKPKLRIAKTINPTVGPYYPGQIVTYSITISNPGPVSVLPVNMVDSLPTISKIANIVVGVPSRGTAAYAATTNKINWNVPFMEVGAQATLTYSLQITDTGAINNTAIVSGPVNFAISDTANVRITSVRLINLKVVKTLQAPTVVNVKDKIAFTIEAENQGPNNATNVVVTDQLLPNIDDPSAIVVSKGVVNFNAVTKQITWTVGNLAVNEKATMTIDTRVIAGGTIENTAIVNGFELESNPNDNRSSIVAVPITGAEIFIPNIFTPNRDGKNDRFTILGIGRFPGSRLTIYNRWGNVVYQNNNYNNEWDGSNLTESTYFYGFELKLPTGEFKKYSGYIQLMR